jgi:hypothetical protein
MEPPFGIHSEYNILSVRELKKSRANSYKVMRLFSSTGHIAFSKSSAKS